MNTNIGDNASIVNDRLMLIVVFLSVVEVVAPNLLAKVTVTKQSRSESQNWEQRSQE